MLPRCFSNNSCNFNPNCPKPLFLAMSPNACEPVSFSKKSLAVLSAVPFKKSVAPSRKDFFGPSDTRFCISVMSLSTFLTPSGVDTMFITGSLLVAMLGDSIAMIAASASSSAEPTGLVSMPISLRT